MKRHPALTLLAVSASVFIFPFVFAHALAAPSSNAVAVANSNPKNIQRNILNEFHQWAESYVAAGAPNKAGLTADGLRMAAERRRVFAELIESDPQEALRQVAPMHL